MPIEQLDYVVIYDHDRRLCIRFHDQFTDCSQRKHCVNFALGAVTLIDLPFNLKTEWYRNPLDLPTKCRSFSVSNSSGKVVRLVFPGESGWFRADDPFPQTRPPQLHTVVGKNVTIQTLGQPLDNAGFFAQLFTYIHVHLGGFCTKGTHLDEPKLADWQDTIEEMKIRVNACEDLLGTRERFDKLEKRVAELMKLKRLLDETSDEPPAKHKKLLVREPLKPGSLREKIVELLKESVAPNGTHIDQLKELLVENDPQLDEQVAIDEAGLARDLEWLQNEGLIFTTSDNDTYASVEGYQINSRA